MVKKMEWVERVTRSGMERAVIVAEWRGGVSGTAERSGVNEV